MDNGSSSTETAVGSAASHQLQRGTDLYAQLEVMMGAVKQESAQLASAKEQLAELELKNKDIPKLTAMLQLESEQNAANTRRLHEADIMVSQLRADMQRLNDIYSKERKLRSDTEQQKQHISNDLGIANKNLHAVSEEMLRMREHMDSQKKQMDEAGYTFGLEKNELVRSLALVRTELEECEKAKKDVSLHFWNIKQDTQQLQDVLTNALHENAELKSQYAKVQSRTLSDNEGWIMLSEDRRSEIIRLTESTTGNVATIRNLQNETKQLYQAIQFQESHTARISKQLADAVGGSQDRIDDMASENRKLTLSLSQAQELAATLSTEIASLKEKANSASKLEVLKRNLEIENERLRSSLKSKEESLECVEASLSQMTATREQEVLSLQSNGSFIEQLQVQLKEANEAKWAHECASNAAHKSLSDELSTAVSNVEDAATRIESLNNDKIRYEEFMKQEIQSAGELGTVLKNELELRLEELATTRRERDSLNGQVGDLSAKVAEMNKTIGRSEAQFRETLESDRAKIQQDLRLKNNRCRTLETEKQELLFETSSLMKQAAEHQARRDSALAQAERGAQQLSMVEEEMMTKDIQINDLTKELKAAQRREKDMSEGFAAKEIEFRKDVSKLDSVIKASAKSATSQVSEMSEKMRILNAISDEQKLRISTLEAADRKAVHDAERRADEMRILNERHEATVQQLSVELVTIRRDLSDTRARHKLSQDDNLKKEREIMSMQTDGNKLEAEVHRYRDRLREAEDRCISTGQQLSSTRKEVDDISTELRRSRASLADQDQQMVVKSRGIERAERELKALEQEGFAETKKLRAKLKDVTGELESLRSAELPRLRKEVQDATASHGKLQTANSSTINGLIAEVNATEDALAKERRSREREVYDYQSNIKELQIQLEKALETISEFTSKSTANNSEKSARVTFLETEVDRLKTVLAVRDERVCELEKQQQGGRSIMQGFRDTQTKLETALAESRRALEHEMSSRRVLEESVKRARNRSMRASRDADDADAGVDIEEQSYSDGDSENGDDGHVNGHKGMRQYLASNSSSSSGHRPMSPIDVFTGAGGSGAGEEEDINDEYTRGTAVSSLSNSPVSTRVSPPKGRGEPSPLYAGSGSGDGDGRKYISKDWANPTGSLRMSPVDEHLHLSSGSPNNRHPAAHNDIRDDGDQGQRQEQMSLLGRSSDSFPARLQKSVQFNASSGEDEDKLKGAYDDHDGDAGSIASLEEEAQDTINRTQMYLQQRLANKKATGNKGPGAPMAAGSGSNRLSADRAVLPSYANPSPLVAVTSVAAVDDMEKSRMRDRDNTNQEANIIEEEEHTGDYVVGDRLNIAYENEEVKQPSVSRRKKPQGLKKAKKKKPAARVEFVGEPGNFHIQSSTMETSASVDNIHFPRISSGKK